MRGDDLVEKLPCRLTPREKELRADDLAREIKRQDELKKSKAEAARVFADTLKDVDARIADLSEQVRTGVERRDVELAERPDYARGVVEVFRMDTGETIRTRSIEPAERQQALFAEAEQRAQFERDMRVRSSDADSEDESSAH